MNAKNITVVATFQAKPGKENELRAALIGLLAPTRKEAGCLSYDLHASPEDPAKFLFHENWADKAALDAHMQAPHI
jgi:quinol monooxygenase YgiN